MNLLAELEGLSGENLITAVLRLLLLRSQEIREEFIRLLSDQCRLGPITVDSHFACIIEHSTEESDKTRWGRLDLLLETSDAVIGLENKLFATFQDGQPNKYLESVQRHAARLSEVRRSKLIHMVAVLAPSSRSREVEDRIQDNLNLLHVSWEQVRKAFKPLTHSLDRDTAVLLQSLDSFLQDRMAFLPRFGDWVPHLQRRFDSFGSAPQNEVVHRLKDFFPYAGPRLSSGKTWLGYYFAEGLKDIRGWFGFIPGTADEILEGRRCGAELIVATTFSMNLPSPPFRPVKLAIGPRFLGLRPDAMIFIWAVDYDRTWDNPEAWQTALAPIREHVEQLAKTMPTGKDIG